MFRGAGFCLDTNCPAYARPNFYMGTEEAYKCRLCGQWGYLEKNHSELHGYGLCRTVTVHFKYDHLSRTYKAQASVIDEALPAKDNTKTFHMYHPFIHVDSSALKLAEKAMADIATGHGGITIDLDMDNKLFKEALSKLDNSLSTSEFLKADLGSDFVPLRRDKCVM